MQTPGAGACIRNSSFAELHCANAVEVGCRKREPAFRKAIHMSVESATLPCAFAFRSTGIKWRNCTFPVQVVLLA